ncbi:MAG: HAMP domain-containing protein [Magnetococcales bacterium]|nr:HAMP domain-containing protein [Magnetococcales bacterium]
MKLGIRGKLFLISLGLILGVVVAVELYLEYALGQWLESRIATELRHHAASARILLKESGAPATIKALDPLADRLGQATSARITLIAADGTVLGDSQLDQEEIQHVENHGYRPEVVMAQRLGQGRSKRYSSTLDTHMLYVAVPYRFTKENPGTIRAAMSLANMDDLHHRLTWILMLAGFMAIAGAITSGGFAAHWFTRAFRNLEQNARTLARDVSSQPIDIDSQDEIGGLASFVNHLARELRETVMALALERGRMNTVLEGMVEGVMAIDNKQRITLINRSAILLFGLPRTPIGGRFSHFVPVKPIHDLLATPPEEKPLSIEFDLVYPAPRRVLVVNNTLPDGQGEVLVIRDVTEIRRLEQIRRDFVGNVSHELRTPVAILQANAETLLDGALEDPKFNRKLVSAMDRHARRLSRIITHLLEISRLEADQYPLALEPVHLETVVQRTLETVEQPMADKNIQLKTDLPPDLLIKADPDVLTQVLNNLVENAIKYSPKGSSIIIRAYRKDHFLRMEVEDDGPGIPEAHHTRIFERFYRVDNGRSREMGGTGLGLSLVKHLVERMGGTVGFEPVTPRGSRFWTVHPLAE